MKPVIAAEVGLRKSRPARRAGVALVVGGALLLTAACGSSGSGSKTASGGDKPAAAATSEAPKTSAAVLTVLPKDGAADVSPKDALQVSVASGTLTNVQVTDSDGTAVPGRISGDGLSWKPAGALSVGTVYHVSAQAKDSAGLVSAATTSFTTLTPAKVASAPDNISTGSSYGVGMIVSVNFTKPVKNKDDVVKAITFETSNNTTVKGHWFGSSRLDFRPEKYWAPGTKVTIHYKLKSVEVSPGVYGSKDRDESFTIGRSKVSTADLSSDMMTVKKGGSTTTIPITGGNDDNPSWNGTMVISDKEKVTRMNSATVSNIVGSEYDVPDVPHAMRLTASGTYVHGNYWGNAFGQSNASHGCISMQDTKDGDDGSVAGKFFADSMIGDVVKIVNSKGKTVSPDNGLSGWTLPWSAW